MTIHWSSFWLGFVSAYGFSALLGIGILAVWAWLGD